MPNVYTQVDFESEIYKKTIYELRLKNKDLENLHYNTKYNSGKKKLLLTDNDDDDELAALRKEFKNMISINNQLMNQIDDEQWTKCCIII